MACRFTSLPQELIDTIFGCLYNHHISSTEYDQTLQSLSLTCKLFSLSARPLLFRKLSLVESYKNEENAARCNYGLLEMLLRNPSLAAMVRVFWTSSMPQQAVSNGAELFQLWLQNQPANFTEDATDLAQLTGLDSWNYPARFGTFCVEMIVTTLPNLECLSLQAGYFVPHEDVYVERFHPPACLTRLKVPSMPKLRNLYVWIHEYARISLLDHGLNALLHAAPNLERLELGGLCPIDQPVDLATIEANIPVLAKLKALTLSQCCMTDDRNGRAFTYIRELARRATALQCFQFWVIDDDAPDFPIGRLIEAFVASSSSIEEFRVYYRMSELLGRQQLARQSLETLTGLRRLGLNSMAFCRHRRDIDTRLVPHTCLVDVVPASVTELFLDLCGDFEMTFRDVEFFAKQVQDGDYPNLEHVELERYGYIEWHVCEVLSADEAFLADHPEGQRYQDMVAALLSAKVRVSIREEA